MTWTLSFDVARALGAKHPDLRRSSKPAVVAMTVTRFASAHSHCGRGRRYAAAFMNVCARMRERFAANTVWLLICALSDGVALQIDCRESRAGSEGLRISRGCAGEDAPSADETPRPLSPNKRRSPRSRGRCCRERKRFPASSKLGVAVVEAAGAALLPYTLADARACAPDASGARVDAVSPAVFAPARGTRRRAPRRCGVVHLSERSSGRARPPPARRDDRMVSEAGDALLQLGAHATEVRTERNWSGRRLEEQAPVRECVHRRALHHPPSRAPAAQVCSPPTLLGWTRRFPPNLAIAKATAEPLRQQQFGVPEAPAASTTASWGQPRCSLSWPARAASRRNSHRD